MAFDFACVLPKSVAPVDCVVGQEQDNGPGEIVAVEPYRESPKPFPL